MMSIEINVIGIKNLMTAEEAREKATSWRNEELQNCLTSLMEQINKTANLGGLSDSYKVSTGRPYEFYETLQQALESLGFVVSPPVNPHAYDKDGWKWWKISW
jgi:hypothetical protein